MKLKKKNNDTFTFKIMLPVCDFVLSAVLFRSHDHPFLVSSLAAAFLLAFPT